MKKAFLISLCVLFCSASAARAADGPAVEKAEPAVKAPAAVGGAADGEAKPAKEPQAAGKILTVDQVLDKMEVARKKLETFQADVVKQRKVEDLDLNEKFSGTLKFKMPRLVRLELTHAETGEQTIYIVGPKFGWIYRVQQKQAERVELKEMGKDEGSANPLEYGLAKDVHKLREAYDLKLKPLVKINKKDALPLELNPKGGEDYTIGKLVFWVDPKTWLLVQIREYKSNGAIIETHTFSNIEVNKRVKGRTFKFKPPKDVEVIIHDVE